MNKNIWEIIQSISQILLTISDMLFIKIVGGMNERSKLDM